MLMPVIQIFKILTAEEEKSAKASTSFQPMRPTNWSQLSLKEVIQPHLPVGLPCYDFIPVIGLTLGASLPCGLSQRLRVKPTPMM